MLEGSSDYSCLHVVHHLYIPVSTSLKQMYSYHEILLQVPNNYETDLIFPIIEKASELANVSYALADDPTKTKLKVWYNLKSVLYP